MRQAAPVSILLSFLLVGPAVLSTAQTPKRRAVNPDEASRAMWFAYCVLAVEAVKLLRAKGFRAMRREDGVPEWRAQGLSVAVGEAPV